MEKNYNENKDIKVKKKRGRPKKIQPTPTPIPPTEQEVLEEWVRNNQEFFFNHNRKSREDLGRVYSLYNIIYNSNKRPGKCGGCHRHIIDTIRKKYYG
jgi:hypothetical protein